MLPMADGLVVVVQHDGALLVLRERSLQAKLDLLFSKHLYVVALSLAQTEQVRAPGPVTFPAAPCRAWAGPPSQGPRQCAVVGLACADCTCWRRRQPSNALHLAIHVRRGCPGVPELAGGR